MAQILITLILLFGLECFPATNNSKTKTSDPTPIPNKVLEDEQLNPNPNDQDIMNNVDTSKLKKKKKSKAISKNSGQCQPGAAGSSGAEMEDFHCTGPAPLGPDTEHQHRHPDPDQQ